MKSPQTHRNSSLKIPKNPCQVEWSDGSAVRCRVQMLEVPSQVAGDGDDSKGDGSDESNLANTVDGWNPANQLRLVVYPCLSHHL